MMRSNLSLVLGSVFLSITLAFNPLPLSTTAVKSTTPTPEVVPILDIKDVVTKVAVTGATGRTGAFVVEELLSRGVNEVLAVVRSMEKAEKMFTNPPENLKFVVCDLTNEKQIQSAFRGCDAAIWCATGFSSNPKASPIQKAMSLFALATKKTVDCVGLPAASNILKEIESKVDGLPKIVLCSSAGVTRPIWDEEKKAMFPGAADIPIVRLNPFGILDVKRESEELLRATGTNYCIVRPSGLNDDWPEGARPVFSQGDIAVGRVNRKDVAKALVDVLSAPEATGKTFEMIGLKGYPPACTINDALVRLSKDADGLIPLEAVAASYSAMQQLLPGEVQDSAKLAMGQTYEQLDKGETGRLGERGTEDAKSQISPSMR